MPCHSNTLAELNSLPMASRVEKNKMKMMMTMRIWMIMIKIDCCMIVAMQMYEQC